jgi:hypothetical protein
MVTLTCQRCGEPFEAKHPRAKWCSERCRKAVQRGAEVVALPGVSAGDDNPSSHGPVYASTLSDLEAAGRVDTWSGQSALVLARRMDEAGRDTGSALAAVQRQLAAAMAEALRGAGAATAPGKLRDELAERRRAHGA